MSNNALILQFAAKGKKKVFFLGESPKKNVQITSMPTTETPGPTKDPRPVWDLTKPLARLLRGEEGENILTGSGGDVGRTRRARLRVAARVHVGLDGEYDINVGHEVAGPEPDQWVVRCRGRV